MKKLTKLTSVQEIEKTIHFFLLQKEGNFTFESAYNDIINNCEIGIDTNVVKEAFIEVLDSLLNCGMIRYYDGFYYSILTDGVEQAI